MYEDEGAAIRFSLHPELCTYKYSTLIVTHEVVQYPDEPVSERELAKPCAIVTHRGFAIGNGSNRRCLSLGGPADVLMVFDALSSHSHGSQGWAACQTEDHHKWDGRTFLWDAGMNECVLDLAKEYEHPHRATSVLYVR